MKKVFLSIFILIASIGYISAQTVAQKVTKDICDCLNQTNIEGKEASAVTEAFQACFLKFAMPNFMELIKEIDIKGDINKEGREMGREMGERLAIDLVKECPTFVSWSMQMSNKGEKAQESEVESKKFDGSFSGTLKGVKSNTYTFITFKDVSGDEVNLVWLKKFDGDDLLLNGKEATTKTKKLQAKWKTIELYDHKTQKYQQFKEIVELIAE